ncbi:MAG: DUF4352 domain-containing protein [Bacillota bacterium]|nr:DUF4352 domain-containing protein [Bacillota bacterium]
MKKQICLIFLLVVIALTGCQITTARTSEKNPAKLTSKAKETAPKNTVKVNINKSITFKNMSIKIVNYTRGADRYKDSGGLITESESGKELLFLNIETTNIGKEKMKDPFYISLVDENKNEIKAWPYFKDNKYNSITELMPGGTKKGLLLYDIGKKDSVVGLVIKTFYDDPNPSHVTIDLPNR